MARRFLAVVALAVAVGAVARVPPTSAGAVVVPSPVLPAPALSAPAAAIDGAAPSKPHPPRDPGKSDESFGQMIERTVTEISRSVWRTARRVARFVARGWEALKRVFSGGR